MKKRNLLVVALILLASPLWAGQLQDKLKGVIVSKSAAAPAGIDEQFDNGDSLTNECSSFTVSGGEGYNSSAYTGAVVILGSTASADSTIEARLRVSTSSIVGIQFRLSGSVGSKTGYEINLYPGRYGSLKTVDTCSATYVSDIDLGVGNAIANGSYFRVKVVISGTTFTPSFDLDDNGSYEITPSAISNSTYQSGKEVGVMSNRGDGTYANFDWVTAE